MNRASIENLNTQIDALEASFQEQHRKFRDIGENFSSSLNNIETSISSKYGLLEASLNTGALKLDQELLNIHTRLRKIERQSEHCSNIIATLELPSTGEHTSSVQSQRFLLQAYGSVEPVDKDSPKPLNILRLPQDTFEVFRRFCLDIFNWYAFSRPLVKILGSATNLYTRIGRAAARIRLLILLYAFLSFIRLVSPLIIGYERFMYPAISRFLKTITGTILHSPTLSFSDRIIFEDVLGRTFRIEYEYFRDWGVGYTKF